MPECLYLEFSVLKKRLKLQAGRFDRMFKGILFTSECFIKNWKCLRKYVVKLFALGVLHHSVPQLNVFI